MSKIHQSTQEEIDAERERVKAAHCDGDGVHTNDMRFWHDWRLWKRDARYTSVGNALSWPQSGWHEVWYCTRCRKTEERTVNLGEEKT
jgi:hypothetical protein